MSKNVFLWALYDFANTPLIAAIGGLYLGQWIVIDNHLPDIYYGGMFSLASLLLLLTSPFLGAWSDKVGKRMPFINGTTYLLIFIGSLLGFIITSSLPKTLRVVFVLILFFILQYVYQASLIFYDALLTKLSTSKTMGKISGIGEAFAELGWMLGPALLLPFATKTITIFGEPGRGQVFLPAVFALAIFGLPMLFWFKEPKAEVRRENIDLKSISKATFQGLKSLLKKNKNVATFLIAFMLFSDAILTADLYFAIFLDQIYKIPDTQKLLFLVLMEVAAIPSGYLLGKVSDKIGTKKLLVFSCLELIVALSTLSLSSSVPLLYTLSVFIGIGWGGFYATARVLLAKISPPSQLGEYFGFYATFQKLASIIGPLVWGGVTLALNNYGIIRYRIAALALVLLMIIGTIVLTKVKEEVYVLPSGSS